MEEHFINHNPKKQTTGDFHKHNDFGMAKKEAIRLAGITGDDIYIYKLVGVIKPKPNYTFIEAIDRLPF